MPPATNLSHFISESKKLWYLAGPAIFSFVSKYSLGAITQIFAGHISTIDLAAVTIENGLIAGFTYGLLLGMGSALETLCGQAVGAGKFEMLGIYTQRSWVVFISMTFPLSLINIFAGPILKLIGQNTDISEVAGTFAIWMIPQLFAFALNFPVAKFLQAQSKIMVISVISGVAMVFHPVFSWLLMLKLRWGLVGAAVVLDGVWWHSWCGKAWSGFSFDAFRDLWGFFRLSLASAVMICLVFCLTFLQQ